MSNFIEEFKKGQAGQNKGLFMGKGLLNLNKSLNGIQKGVHYAVAAAPKVGKSSFVNYAFLLEPYLYSIENNIPVEWIYFSFEMDRLQMEFDFACYFLYHKYQIFNIQLPNECHVKKQNIIQISSGYLRGKIQDDSGNTVKVDENIVEKLKLVYRNYIIPIFGEYDKYGNLLKKGVVDFVTHKENPTGLRRYILRKAEEEGEFIKDTVTFYSKEEKKDVSYNKVLSYKPHNEEKFVIIITDTVRKIPKERGFTNKDNIDKWLEYANEIKKLCGYTFVDIIHLNRTLADLDNLKFKKDFIYPTSENIKESGNLSEECDYIFTMFNPNDDKYNLKTHFGIPIRDSSLNPIYPDMRTIHLVESRHTEAPQHFKTLMKGNIKSFKQLDI